MSIKSTILLVIVGVVLLLVVGQLMWTFGKKQDNDTIIPQEAMQTTTENTDNILPNNQTSTNVSIDATSQTKREPIRSVISEEDKTKQQLTAISDSFAAIYGSYSNQTNFENLKDLKYFMTDDMKKWADDYMNKQASNSKPKIYFGVTTKALKSEVENLNENTAKVLVQTQRKESTGTQDNYRVYYQDLEIEFKKVGTVWKVDEVNWR